MPRTVAVPTIPRLDQTEYLWFGALRIVLRRISDLLLVFMVGNDMERRPVGVAGGRRRRLAVPVVHEALRSRDPLEDRVGCSNEMAADDENPLRAIRVTDAKNHEARPVVGRVADVVVR